MTDPLAPDELALGLGHIPDEPDIRDYPIESLYIAEGMVAARQLPASFVVPGMPAVLDQGATPRCVAFSSAAMKGYQDHIDQGHWYDFDEGLFFHEIGGTARGARARDAMEHLLHNGYPIDMDPHNDQVHKITAYYTVPTEYDAIRAAILDFGPVIVTTTWYRSWFRPSGRGVLPAPTSSVGGHGVVAYGWDARGLRCRNSWGKTWGVDGDFWMPEQYVRHLTGAWKTVDQVVHPIPYRHTVKVTASDGSLNIRSRPNTAGKMVGRIARGKTVGVLELEKFGGKYHVNGVSRNDWLRTHKGWMARGWTRLVG